MRGLFALIVCAALGLSLGAQAQSASGSYGPSGVRKVGSAQVGNGLLFGGAHGRGFFMPDFIAPGEDADTYGGATFFFGARLFEFIELSLAAQVGANANSFDDPSTRYTAGDLFPSAKVGYALGNIALGLDLRAGFPTLLDAGGLDFGNANLATTGLFTLDLSESAFVRLHVNAGYVYQFGKADRTNLYQGLSGHLLSLATQQWFYDQVFLGVAAEVPVDDFNFYLEVVSQSAFSVPAGAGPNGGDYTPILDGQATVSPGIRWSPATNIAVDLGADFALLGTAQDFQALTEGQPINPLYAVHLGVSFAIDPFAKPGAAVVERRGSPTPKGGGDTGTIAACVKDSMTGDGIAGAYIDLDGGGARLAAGDDGCFESYPLALEERALTISHPDYKSASAARTVVKDGAPGEPIKLEPIVRPGRFAGTVKDKTGTDATVTMMIQRGDDVMKEQEVTGDFEFELKAGDYQVLLKGDKYLQQGAPLSIKQDEAVTRAFIMKDIPKKRLSKVEKGRIKIKLKIPFRVGRAELLKAAEFVLDDVVDTLLNNSQVKKVRIEGHTDNSGNKAKNQSLSEARAQAVYAYLVDKGVPKARMEAEGFGQAKPVASNRTERGKAKNRRVEFVIVEETP